MYEERCGDDAKEGGAVDGLFTLSTSNDGLVSGNDREDITFLMEDVISFKRIT